MPIDAGKFDGCWSYRFQARGLGFLMTVGRSIPTDIRKGCCITSPDKWIWTSDDKVRTKALLSRLMLARGHKMGRISSVE